MKSESIARIKIWIEELRAIIFTPVKDIQFEYFTTYDNIGFDAAEKSECFECAHSGMRWGKKWQYGWFRAAIVMPESISGRCVFMVPDVGGEMLVRVNGIYAGTRDLKHEGITLTKCAKAGEHYDILIESYAGHGPRPEHGGPLRYSERMAKDCDVLSSTTQVCVGKPCIGVWNEEAYQLYIDAVTLYQLYTCLDERSLRAQKILAGLFGFTRIVDFEICDTERDLTIESASRHLKPLLECVNGSTAPCYTIFGQSHLDLAWKWHWDETRRKCARTYANQLALIDEYPEYIFMGCEPPLFEELERSYPQIFDMIKEKIADGNIVPEGGMYVETDTNLVCGEALIRQCIYGRQYYGEKLGTDTKMVWLPDCFGFCGQLPQILKKSGIDYFATQKISRALSGCERFPYNSFYWQGIDGTKILTHFFRKNNARYEVTELYNRWYKEREQNEDIEEMLFPFGYGDGGGGATRDMLETVRRTRDLEGLPRTRIESPVSFFERLEKTNVKNVYCGEIYLPWHRGTYTAQAELKRLNRRAESALRDAELWSTIAYIQSGDKVLGAKRHETLKALWKRLLFLHFHDIIPGSSIERVNVEAREEFKAIVEQSHILCGEAREAVLAACGAGNGQYLWNSLSWERENVPSIGFAGINDRCAVNSCTDISNSTDGIVCENSHIRFIINSAAEITSIVEKKSGIEFCAGSCNHFRLLKDINIDYDAWEMASFVDDEETASVTLETREFYSDTEGAHILFDGTIGSSHIEQEVFLGSDSHEIELRTKVDWKECHKLLKVDFPIAIRTDESLEETAFGYVKRPVHRSRQYEKDRFEVSQHRYTALAEDDRCFAVLNDSKYGVSTKENVISLSLLRAPKIPDANADMGVHCFTYALYPSGTSFLKSGIVNAGYELNSKLETTKFKSDIRNMQSSGEIFNISFLEISSKNIILEMIKCAEDGSGDIILRLYQSHNCHETACISLLADMSECYKTDMLEQRQCRLDLIRRDGRTELMLEAEPFEIVTLRFCGLS